MKIACPVCKAATEIEHVEYGCNIECVCGAKFILDKDSVIAEYSEIDSIIPERVGLYRITEFIGYGGMGKIYKAIHPTLGLPVAIKAMRQEFINNPASCERFVKSAKICARVNHPNIVRVYDCGYAGDNLFLVMEYIGGGSAQDLIDKYGAVDQIKTAEIAAGVCTGLAEAERRGIVHRDIKPENIMFDTDGTVKLLDLGLARIIGDNRINKFSETLTNTSLGTAHYMPPEQSIDAKSCDARSDIYSLGVTMYQLATGEYPFDSPDHKVLRRMHAMEKPLPPGQRKPGISPDMDYIILKCMEKKRSDRYRCADELAMDLDAFLNNRVLPSRFVLKRFSGEDTISSCKKKLRIALLAWNELAAAHPLFKPRYLAAMLFALALLAVSAAYFLH